MDQFENKTFVPIIIRLNEFSDSEARDLLSMFSEEEIKDFAIRNISQGIGVDLTEGAFFRLIQDGRIDKIYYAPPAYLTSKKQDFVKKVSIFLLVLLIVIILVLYFIIKKRRKK